MKKIHCLMAAFGCLLFGFNTHAAVINGKIANAKVKWVYLFKAIYGMPNQMMKVDSAIMNTDGTFKLTHAIKSPALFYLGIGSNNVKMYLKNDYTMTLRCDVDKWPQSIAFTEGTGKIENTIFLQMRLNYFNSNGLGDIMKYNGFTYSTFVDSITNAMQGAYSAMKGENKMDVLFDTMINTEIRYTKNNMLLMFNIIKSYYTTGKGSYVSENPKYFDFLKSVKFNDEILALSDAYVMFMLNYCHYSMTQTVYKDAETPGFDGPNQLAYAKEHYKGAVRDYCVATILKLRIDQHDVSNIKPEIDDFKKYVSDNDYYTWVAKAYAKLAEFMPGNPFPDFSLPDSSGVKHSIKELKGKIVYIDYWASWCGPCRMEMPHSKEIMEKYKNNPKVAFVFVSIDNDRNNWLNAMHKENLKGLHLLASGGWSDAVCKKFGISSIPRYMLIDQNGNIVNIEAKRPSSGIDKEIDALLLSKNK